jgi:hypothetical protein
MAKTIKPRKTPQQARSRQTREDILEATAHLLNRRPFGEVSTNHIWLTFRWYSCSKMQNSSDESSKALHPEIRIVDDLVEALMTVHREDAQVRGVVYQNLERLNLFGPAQSATRKIQAKGTVSVPELNPIQTWVAISAINAAVHSTSQLPRELQQWDFVRVLVRDIFDNLLAPRGPQGRPKQMKP